MPASAPPARAGGTGRADRRAGGPVPHGWRALPPGHGEQVLLVCALVAGAQVTWGAVVPALPAFGESLGVQATLLGAIVAAFGLGRLIVNVPAGLLADRWGPRGLLLGAAAGLVVITPMTAVVEGIGAVLALRVAAGVLGGTVVTVGLALVARRTPPAARASVMTAAQAAQLLGAALGPVVGGFTLAAWGPRAVFATAIGPLVLALAWALVRQRRSYTALDPAIVDRATSGDVPDGESSPPRGAHVASAPVADPAVRPAGAVAALIAVNLAGFAVFLARFGGEQTLTPVLAYPAGLTPRGLGLAMATVTLAGLALMPVTAALLERGWRRRLMVPALVLTAAMTALYPLVGGGAFAAALIVAGVGLTVAGVVPAVVLAERVAPERQGRATGVFRTCGDAGAVLGPLAVGLMLEQGPTPAAAGTAGALLVCALVCQAMLGSSRRLPSPA